MKRLLFTLLSLLRFVDCGQIFGYDIIVDQVNVNLITRYTLVFQLESGLTSSDYLRLIMPYNLHSTLTGNVPNAIIASFTTHQNLSLTNELQYTPCVLQFVSGAYYIQFLSSSGVSVGLDAGVFYSLRLQTSTGAATPTSGCKDPIQLYTVSAIDIKAFVYDSNPMFGVLYLQSAAPNTLVASQSIQDIQQGTPSQTYNFSLTILNKIASTKPTVYKIFLPQDGPQYFIFNNQICLSQTQVYSTFTIQSLASTDYSCGVDTVNNIIYFKVFTAQDINSRLIITAEVKNPNFVHQAQSINIYRMYLQSAEVLEYTSIANMFNVNYFTLISSAFKLAWGLPQTQEVAPQWFLSIVRNYQASPGILLYNSLTFEFSLNYETPQNQQLELTLDLRTTDYSGYYSSVLEGSIKHNLPQYNVDKPAICTVINNNVQTNPNFRYLFCKNVGQFLTQKDVSKYFISFKMVFNFDQNVNAQLDSLFSQLYIYSINSATGARYSFPILNGQVIVSNIKTRTNADRYRYSQYSSVTSQYFDGNTATYNVPYPYSNGGFLGMQALGANVKQQLIVYTYMFNYQYGAQADGNGFYMIVNPSIIFSDTVKTYCNHQPYQKQISTKLQRLQVDNYGWTQLLYYSYNYYYPYWCGYYPIGFSDVYISFHSSLYADERVYDFYFLKTDYVFNSNPSNFELFMSNAYTITTPKPFNYYFGMANGWTGWYMNVGAYIPTLIRLTGYMTDTEVNGGVDRLFVFLDGLDVFPVSNDKYENNFQVSCSSSLGTNQDGITCQGYSSSLNPSEQNYLHYNQVVIQFPTQLPTSSINIFEILIPVKNVRYRTQINIFIGTASIDPQFPNYYRLQAVYRMTGDQNLRDNANQLLSLVNREDLPNSYQYAGAKILDYSIDLMAASVGAVADQAVAHGYHSENTTVVGTNSQSSQDSYNGAGFTFTCYWKFLQTNTQYIWNGALETSTYKCLSFSYNFNVVTNSWRYGFFCPMDQGSSQTVSVVYIKNFLVPSVYGQTLPNTAFAYSRTNGELATMFYYAPIIGFANSIFADFNAVQPVVPISNKDFRLIWTFYTSNPIPNTAKIVITFENNPNFATMGAICIIKTSITHTCAATYTYPTLTFTISGCTQCPFPSGKIQVLHYLSDPPTAVHADIRFKIAVILGTSTIDQTPTNQGYPCFLSFNNNGLLNNIDVDSTLLLQNNFLNSYTNFTINFGAYQRGFNYGEKLVFNFGNTGVSLGLVNTAASPIYCIVYDLVLKKMSNLWTSLDFTTVTAVTLIAEVDISYTDKYSFQLMCFNVKLNTAQITVHPNVKLIANSGGQTLLNSVTITVPTLVAAKVFSSIALTKTYFNTVGSKTKIQITIATSAAAQADTNQKIISITFPTYYLPKITEEGSLYCEINSLKSQCYVQTNWKIIISNLPTSISSLVISIYGITLPKITIVQPLFVAILKQTQTSSTDYLEYGEVTDLITSVSTPQVLKVSNFTLDTSDIQTPANIRFVVSLSSTLFSGSGVQLNMYFPIQWMNMLQYYTPTISASRLSNLATLTVSSITIKDSIKFVLTGSAAVAEEEYLILINSVENPQSIVPELSRKWIIEATPATETQVVQYRTFANLQLIDQFSFNPNYQKVLLQWQYPENSNRFLFRKGCFNTQISLITLTGQPFTKPFQIDLIDKTSFTLSPSLPSVAQGSLKFTFYMTVNANTPSGVYSAFFKKTIDHFNIYSDLPVCYIEIVGSTHQIDVLTSNVIVPKGGASLPIVLTFHDPTIYVTKTVKIVPTILNGASLLLSTDQSSGISIGKDVQSVMFQFKAQETALVGTQTVVSFYILDLGQNVASYFSFNSSLQLTVDLLNQSPVAYYINFVSQEIMITSASFTLNCGSDGSIFFKVSKKQKASTTDVAALRTEIITQATNFYQYDPLDPLQKQYGMQIIDTQETINQVLSVGNSLSGLDYSFFALCQNSFLQTSRNYLEIDFTSQSNGGKLMKIDFIFAEQISYEEEIKLTCLLSMFFELDPRQVKTVHKIGCEAVANQIDLTYSSESTKSSYIDANQTLTISVYFSPQRNSEVDNINQILQNTTQATTFKFSLAQFIITNKDYQFSEYSLGLSSSIQAKSFPLIESISDFKEASYSIPQIDENSYIIIEAFSPNVKIRNIQLTASGFVYIGLGSATQVIPTIYQFFKGLDGDNTPLAYGLQQGFYNGTQLEFNFKNLPPSMDTQFTLFLATTLEDVSDQIDEVSVVSQFISYDTIITAIQTHGRLLQASIIMIIGLFVI